MVGTGWQSMKGSAESHRGDQASGRLYDELDLETDESDGQGDELLDAASWIDDEETEPEDVLLLSQEDAWYPDDVWGGAEEHWQLEDEAMDSSLAGRSAPAAYTAPAAYAAPAAHMAQGAFRELSVAYASADEDETLIFDEDDPDDE